MNTENALKLLDQVCCQVSLPREGHVQIQQALEVIKKAIENPKKEEKEI